MSPRPPCLAWSPEGHRLCRRGRELSRQLVAVPPLISRCWPRPHVHAPSGRSSAPAGAARGLGLATPRLDSTRSFNSENADRHRPCAGAPANVDKARSQARLRLWLRGHRAGSTAVCAGHGAQRDERVPTEPANVGASQRCGHLAPGPGPWPHTGSRSQLSAMTKAGTPSSSSGVAARARLDATSAQQAPSPSRTCCPEWQGWGCGGGEGSGEARRRDYSRGTWDLSWLPCFSQLTPPGPGGKAGRGRYPVPVRPSAAPVTMRPSPRAASHVCDPWGGRPVSHPQLQPWREALKGAGLSGG